MCFKKQEREPLHLKIQNLVFGFSNVKYFAPVRLESEEGREWRKSRARDKRAVSDSQWVMLYSTQSHNDALNPFSKMHLGSQTS